MSELLKPRSTWKSFSIPEIIQGMSSKERPKQDYPTRLSDVWDRRAAPGKENPFSAKWVIGSKHFAKPLSEKPKRSSKKKKHWRKTKYPGWGWLLLTRSGEFADADWTCSQSVLQTVAQRRTFQSTQALVWGLGEDEGRPATSQDSESSISKGYRPLRRCPRLHLARISLGTRLPREKEMVINIRYLEHSL